MKLHSSTTFPQSVQDAIAKHNHDLDIVIEDFKAARTAVESTEAEKLAATTYTAIQTLTKRLEKERGTLWAAASALVSAVESTTRFDPIVAAIDHELGIRVGDLDEKIQEIHAFFDLQGIPWGLVQLPMQSSACRMIECSKDSLVRIKSIVSMFCLTGTVLPLDRSCVDSVDIGKVKAVIDKLRQG
jgi:hypothetical protein